MIRFTLLFLLGFLYACSGDRTSRALPDAHDEPALANKTAPRPNPWKNNGCALVSENDIRRLFGIDPQAALLNTRSLPDQAFCLRTWNKPDWKERESQNEIKGAEYREPHNRLVVQVFDYGTDLMCAQQFEMLRRDRRDTYDKDVKGIGEDGLWSTGTLTLLVKKEHLALSVSLEYTDNPMDNLPKATEVAQVALSKM
ncbi:MAG: hypothetical protein ACK4NS_09285 [Saprospiraceae bacterium]